MLCSRANQYSILIVAIFLFFQDIRNQLNATKPLVDKLRSYSLLLSPNSDSTTIKQLDLDIKSLDDEAKSLSSIIDSNIKQLGHTLTLWETTQSNLENFVAWLKEIKSFLNPDVPNKYNALVNELEKLEVWQNIILLQYNSTYKADIIFDPFMVAKTLISISHKASDILLSNKQDKKHKLISLLHSRHVLTSLDSTVARF